jgi:hypothetical protein
VDGVLRFLQKESSDISPTIGLVPAENMAEHGSVLDTATLAVCPVQGKAGRVHSKDGDLEPKGAPSEEAG